jgi:hypothetical protein
LTTKGSFYHHPFTSFSRDIYPDKKDIYKITKKLLKAGLLDMEKTL